MGLTHQQIEALNWKGRQPILTGFGVREAVDAASELRRQIREADDTVDERRLQNLWREAQDAVAEVRLFGDLVLAAFFEGAKPKERESRRTAYQEAILTGEAWRHAVGDGGAPQRGTAVRSVPLGNRIPGGIRTRQPRLRRLRRQPAIRRQEQRRSR